VTITPDGCRHGRVRDRAAELP